MLIFSWKKWADPQIDFGRELYIPWQLSEGKVLYRDIFHLFGPLSQYFNASLFKIFGVSWNVLIVANTVLLCAFVYLLFQVLRTITGKTEVILCLIAFLCQFAFGHYLEIGNYNYIAPYAHEMIHGLYLSILLLYVLIKYPHTRPKTCGALSGIIWGAILLTKPEFILASSGVIAMYLLLEIKSHNISWFGNYLWTFIVSSMILPSCFIIYFLQFNDLVNAIADTFQAIGMVGKIKPYNNHFYLQLSGWLEPGANLFQQFRAVFMFGIVLSALYWQSCRVQTSGYSRISSWSMGLLLIGALLFPFEWTSLGTLLPASVLLLFAIQLWNLKTQGLRGLGRQNKQMLLLITLAGLLLVKTALQVQIFHYGFVLAVPAAFCWIILIYNLPQLLGKKRTSLYSSGVIFLVVGASLFNLTTTISKYSSETNLLASTQEYIWTLSPQEYAHANGTTLAQEWLTNNLEAGETLAVIPEGIMLNFMNRATSPLKVINFLPHEVEVYGKNRLLEDLKLNPPNIILYLYRDLEEYDYGGFGDSNYLPDMHKWITDNYHRDSILNNINTNPEILQFMVAYRKN